LIVLLFKFIINENFYQIKKYLFVFYDFYFWGNLSFLMIFVVRMDGIGIVYFDDNYRMICFCPIYQKVIKIMINLETNITILKIYRE